MYFIFGNDLQHKKNPNESDRGTKAGGKKIEIGREQKGRVPIHNTDGQSDESELCHGESFSPTGQKSPV